MSYAEGNQPTERLQVLLTGELTRVQQRERQHLATLLHDHVQQLLVGARLQLGFLRQQPCTAQARAAIERTDEQLRQAIAATRSLSVNLHPPVLRESGLCAALLWLARRMQELSQLTVEVRADAEAEPASAEVRALLFEGARELLFNSFKHSGVSTARVLLSGTAGGGSRLTVEDEGAGFDPGTLEGAADPGFGLFSVRQRMAHLGGRMEIQSAPGKGARVTLIAPGPSSP